MKQLNEEEKKIIKKIESTGKWDALTYDISILVPCFLVTIISVLNNSVAGVFSGFLAYMIIRLWISVKQGKTVSIMRSAIKKMYLENEEEPSNKKMHPIA